MKITHNKVGQNLNLRDTNKTDKADKAGAIKESSFNKADALKDLGNTDSASKVDISSQAQTLRKAREIAMATPDVDEAKVARLQKLIDDGKYKTDAAAIADRMVDEQLKWE